MTVCNDNNLRNHKHATMQPSVTSSNYSSTCLQLSYRLFRDDCEIQFARLAPNLSAPCWTDYLIRQRLSETTVNYYLDSTVCNASHLQFVFRCRSSFASSCRNAWNSWVARNDVKLDSSTYVMELVQNDRDLGDYWGVWNKPKLIRRCFSPQGG